MSQYLLGIDNGSTVSKAALFDDEGRELAVAGRKVHSVEAAPGWSERNAEEVWRDTAAAVREVLDRAGVDPGRIAAVACTGYGNGLHLLDAAGRPVRMAINSMDWRARPYVERWQAEGIGEAVRAQTAQSLWPGQPNALLAWLRDHEPEVLGRAAWVVACKDYTRFRLCGRIQAELTDMSATSLMDVVAARYDDRVLQAFGLAEMRRLLPPLVPTAEICGTVTAEAAAETGLRPGTPVAAGMFDIDACALASGITDEGPMSLVAGTWGNNQYIARQPLIDAGLFMTSCFSMPGWYLMLEGSPTSASNLDWFVREFVADAAAGAQRSPLEWCGEMAASVACDEAGPIFLPFLYGSNAQPRARGCLVGLEGRHTRAHATRAVYEGIVFAHQTHLRRLLQFRAAPTAIRFTGGAARSAFWVQMFADAFQIPMEIPAGSELGALGAAIAAAVACGRYVGFPQAVAAMTRLARRYEPDPTLAGLYAAKYERYQRVVQSLGAVWDSF